MPCPRPSPQKCFSAEAHTSLSDDLLKSRKKSLVSFKAEMSEYPASGNLHSVPSAMIQHTGDTGPHPRSRRVKIAVDIGPLTHLER
eukprot:5041529-Pyramimonas_sp.AAC.1